MQARRQQFYSGKATAEGSQRSKVYLICPVREEGKSTYMAMKKYECTQAIIIGDIENRVIPHKNKSTKLLTNIKSSSDSC